MESKNVRLQSSGPTDEGRTGQTLRIKLILSGAILSVWLILVLNSINPGKNTIIAIALQALLFFPHAIAFRVFQLLSPIALSFATFQAQVLFLDQFRSRIRVEEPYAFDLKFFGMSLNGQTLTPPEWWQYHTHWILDFFCGIFYVGFVPIFIGFVLFYAFILGRSAVKRSLEYRREAIRLSWGYFWANLMGYITYFIYPAAPPWYVAQFGFGPADLHAAPSSAGAARFDVLLGIDLFEKMYSVSPNVFGAIPSLHVAYPALVLFSCLRLKALRLPAIVFFSGVSFAAVYLNHHYIIDILLGWAYAFGTMAVLTYGRSFIQILQARKSAFTNSASDEKMRKGM